MPEGHLTETQIGAVCENMVANALVVGSNGRLSPFQPYADDGGVDMLVFDKDTRKFIACQIKGRRNTIKRFPNCVHFEVRKATFDTHNYLLAVLLAWEKQDIECAWLIPMLELASSLRNSGKYVIRPSRSPTTEDRFSQYQHQSMASLADGIVKIIDGPGEESACPTIGEQP